jgi:hypothetical protein
LERLPDPPPIGELRLKTPETRSVPVGTLLWRIFPTEGPFPVQWDEFRAFGPTASRFDHHPEDPPPRVHRDHWILYAADRYSCAFAEYFQDGRAINRTRNKPWIVNFATDKALSLLDVTGGWMLKAGGGAAIATGERAQSRKWSRAFHAAWPDIDGICYRSSLNPDWLAFAFYERARRAMPRVPLLHAPLTDSRVAALVANAAGETGYDLL